MLKNPLCEDLEVTVAFKDTFTEDVISYLENGGKVVTPCSCTSYKVDTENNVIYFTIKLPKISPLWTEKFFPKEVFPYIKLDNKIIRYHIKFLVHRCIDS